MLPFPVTLQQFLCLESEGTIVAPAGLPHGPVVPLDVFDDVRQCVEVAAVLALAALEARVATAIHQGRLQVLARVDVSRHLGQRLSRTERATLAGKYLKSAKGQNTFLSI